MKMNHSLPILALAVLPFAGALNAQDSKPFDAGVALALATDNLKEITNSGGFGGVNLDIGFNTKLAGTTVPLRLSLGINDFPGQSNNGVKTSLLGYQLAADIFIQAGSPNFFLVTGISINKWSMSKSPEPAGYSSSVKGPKFGGRLGVEYRFNTSWSGHVMLQGSEIGTDAKATKGLNASWVQIGAKYHF